MTALQKPIVNLNGATRAELIREHMDIANALRTAKAIMGARLPHGRDYQTSREAFQCEKAREAFTERMITLKRMADEFEAVALALHYGGESSKVFGERA